MKKKVLSLILSLVMVFGVFVFVPAATLPVVADTWNASAATPTITTNADMAAFAAAVTGGNTFAGKTIKLAGDVTLSTTVGGVTSVHPFSGNFDGQGHTVTINQSFTGTQKDGGGLFSLVRVPSGTTLTIQNVHVAGVINIQPSSDYSAGQKGGLVSMVETAGSGATLNITNCWSSVRIEQTNSCGEGNIGGFIGYVSHNNSYLNPLTITFESCLWDGSIFFKNQPDAVAGFIGYTGQNKSGRPVTINFRNTVAAGTIDLNQAYGNRVATFIGQLDGSQSGSTTTVNATNVLSFGYFQTSTGLSSFGSGDARNYGNFIRTNDNSYTALNLTNFYWYEWTMANKTAYLVNLSSTGVSQTKVVKYTNCDASFKALTGSNFSDSSKWTFISGSYPTPKGLYDKFGNPWVVEIGSDAAMTAFANAVTNGNAFFGKTVKLTANVNLTTTVGKVGSSGDRKWFSGSFDGQGHTVTITQSISNPDGDGGLFSMVRIPINCTITIKNVHLTGTITLTNNTTSKGYTGGLISAVDSGFAGSGGTINITNVWNSVYVSCGNANAWTCIGGMIAFTRHEGNLKPLTINFESCFWDGTLNTGPAAYYFGGFVGYTGNNNAGRTLNINISNCVCSGKIALNIDWNQQAGMLIGYAKGSTSDNATAKVTINISNVVSTGKMTFRDGTPGSGSKLGLVAWTDGTTALNLSRVYYYAFGRGAVGGTCTALGSGTVTSSSNVTAKDAAGFQALNSTTDNAWNAFNTASEKWMQKATYEFNATSTSNLPMVAGIYGIFMSSSGYTKFYDENATTYNISSADDMMDFASAVTEGCVFFTGKTVQLTTNISLSGKTWKSIGLRVSNACGPRFCGTFDGKNYAISEFKSTQTADDTGAFFGFLGDGAIIKNVWFKAPSSGYNLTLPSASGVTTTFVSPLVDVCHGTVQITNVRNSMTVSASRNINNVGGFVAFMDNTANTSLTISGCVYDGRFDCGNYVSDTGCFVGATGNNNGKTKTLVIENCLNAGTIYMNSNEYYYENGGFIGYVKLKNTGSTSVTIRNCVSSERSFSFHTNESWSSENNGDCGQVIGAVDSGVSLTINNVYYNPSYLHTTAGSAATKRYLGEIGVNNTTHNVDVAGAHFCSPIDFAALTTSNLSSSWTVGSVTSSTVTVPVPTYVKTNLSLTAPTFPNTAGYVSATGKSTSAYSGSLTFTVTYQSGVSNIGSKDANCGVILVSNTKFKALASSGAITYSTLTAANCGTRVAALKGTQASSTGTMKVVISQFTSNSGKQSEEYFVIPYIGSTIYLDGARLIAYSAL